MKNNRKESTRFLSIVTKYFKNISMLTNSSLVNYFRFEFNNSYIWIEFYHAPLDKDIKMICDVSYFHSTPYTIKIITLMTRIFVYIHGK